MSHSATRAGTGISGRYKELGAVASQIATAAFSVHVPLGIIVLEFPPAQVSVRANGTHRRDFHTYTVMHG